MAFLLTFCSLAPTFPSHFWTHFKTVLSGQLAVALCSAIVSYTQSDYKQAAAIIDQLPTEAAGEFWGHTVGVGGLLVGAQPILTTM